MFDFDMACVIVIGLIAVIAGVVQAGIRKIGDVLRIVGDEDRPDHDPSDPPDDFFGDNE